MAPRVNVKLCSRKSRFGRCRRTLGHGGVHAAHIGDAFWFAWEGRYPLGYGHFSHGRFVPQIAAEKGVA
jgi:hypothetical protein